MSNNGELTFTKAFEKVQVHDISTPDFLQEYCEAITFIETAFGNIIESMEWMLTQLKWKHRSQLNMESEVLFPDKDVPWSPEIIKAMEVLEKLKQR